MKPYSTLRQVAGFTLVEALAVLAVLAVLVGIGTPMMSSFIQSGQVRTTALDLVADLQFARSEAIKRNATVSVLPVTGNTWSAGWRVYAGADDTAPVLRERLRTAGQTTVTGATTGFTFAGNGRIPGVIPNVQICPAQSGATTGRVVEVQLSGLARSQTVTGCSS